MLKRLALALSITLAPMPVLAQTSYLTGVGPQDNNPQPEKLQCWTGSAWAPCSATNPLYTSSSGSGSSSVTQGTSPWVDNVSQFGGSAVVTGTGASGAGIPRVTISNDSVISSITNTVPVQGSIANGVSVTGVNPIGIGGVAASSAPSAVVAGQRTNIWTSLNGATVVSTSIPGLTDGLSISANAAPLTSPNGNNSILGVLNYYYDGTVARFTRGNTDGAYMLTAPTATTAGSLTSATVAGVATNQLKATAGNVYSLNVVNNTTAGFVVLYDSATTPTSGTALTTGLIRYCFPVAASAGFDKVFQMPMQMASGAVELFSTSCTTYTAPSTLPIILTGQVK